MPGKNYRSGVQLFENPSPSPWNTSIITALWCLGTLGRRRHFIRPLLRWETPVSRTTKIYFFPHRAPPIPPEQNWPQIHGLSDPCFSIERRQIFRRDLLAWIFIIEMYLKYFFIYFVIYFVILFCYLIFYQFCYLILHENLEK